MSSTCTQNLLNCCEYTTDFYYKKNVQTLSEFVEYNHHKLIKA